MFVLGVYKDRVGRGVGYGVFCGSSVCSLCSVEKGFCIGVVMMCSCWVLELSRVRIDSYRGLGLGVLLGEEKWSLLK